jgi:hypothetical protein
VISGSSISYQSDEVVDKADREHYDVTICALSDVLVSEYESSNGCLNDTEYDKTNEYTLRNTVMNMSTNSTVCFMISNSLVFSSLMFSS